MNLRDLKKEVGALRLHDLADTNALGVRVDGGAVLVEFDTAQIESDLAEAREERDDAEKELKECERERDEWERRAGELEAAAEDVKSPESSELHHAREELTRFRTAAANWAQEVERMRAEVQALRKRKGVAAGVAAYSHEIWTLLCYVSQTEGRYRQEAAALVSKINSL